MLAPGKDCSVLLCSNLASLAVPYPLKGTEYAPLENLYFRHSEKDLSSLVSS